MTRQQKGYKGADATSQSPSKAQRGPPARDEPPLLFHQPREEHGEFCQWYPSSFTVRKSQISSLVGHPVDDPSTTTSTNAEIDNITFTCAEQFMMFCKASRFRDYEIQSLVLATDNPKDQKNLGRGVRGFDDDYWDEVKSAVVLAGSIAKFGQNADLKRKLLATGNRELAEAAKMDRVWGIGFSAKDALSHRGQWGENRLGKALMEAREHLRLDNDADEER